MFGIGKRGTFVRGLIGRQNVPFDKTISDHFPPLHSIMHSPIFKQQNNMYFAYVPYFNFLFILVSLHKLNENFVFEIFCQKKSSFFFRELKFYYFHNLLRISFAICFRKKDHREIVYCSISGILLLALLCGKCDGNAKGICKLSKLKIICINVKGSITKLWELHSSHT